MNFEAMRQASTAELVAIDASLAAYLSCERGPDSHYSMIRYHLGFSELPISGSDKPVSARGKRLRAVLALLVGRAASARRSRMVKLLLATEMVHAASLVHDDIQDGDELRWGRPTLWSRYGVDQAINVGDSMQALTYELLLDLTDEGLASDALLRLLRVFNLAHRRMTEGQHLDLLHQGRMDLDVEGYLDMIARKTAAAIECATHSAAIVAGCTPEVEESYRAFGHAFGLLYQVCDDMHAIWGKTQETGKIELRDVMLRKCSLPLLLAVERGSPELRKLLVDPSAERFSSEQAVRIRQGLADLGVRQLCGQYVRRLLGQAIAALARVESDKPEHAQLAKIARLCAATAGVCTSSEQSRDQVLEESAV